MVFTLHLDNGTYLACEPAALQLRQQVAGIVHLGFIHPTVGWVNLMSYPCDLVATGGNAIEGKQPTDEELAELRRMAGLENKQEGAS